MWFFMFNPLATVPPEIARPITHCSTRNRPKLFSSFIHAIELHQTAVDRAQSQDYGGLQITHVTKGRK